MGCSACKEQRTEAENMRVSADEGMLSIALVGNPNCGKTTAFNMLTGARQHVGNYPGVTVDRKEGTALVDGVPVRLVDLPGAYSLTAFSQEEVVVRQVLAPVDKAERPLAVCDVVEACALERSLYLTVQIMELGLPVVLVCNMMDEARKAGVHVNLKELSSRLGIPVVEAVARTGEGLQGALRQTILAGRTARQNGSTPLTISYGPDLDPVLGAMSAFIEERSILGGRYPARWIALKILENDAKILEELRADSPDAMDWLEEQYAKVANHIKDTHEVAPDAIIADYRYGFIRGVVRGVVKKAADRQDRLAMTDRIDKVLTNTLIGPLFMLAVMYLMFYVTFEVGAYPQGWVEDAFGWLGDTATENLPEGLLRSLIVSGLIDGLGGVLSFVPLIAIMFLMIAFLEDSGYMARIAYMLDRVFRVFGLHGASVMPYIISGGIAGGCAIPGAMATRTLHSPKEKLATLLTLPYMACGAKLPVFLLLAGVFFPENAAGVMFGLLLAGWASALIIARILRGTIIRGQATPFIMELPPYRLPSLRSVLIHCWERTFMYLRKAGTVLVAVSILIWASMTFPGLDEDHAAPFEQAIAAAEAQLEQAPEGSPEREALEAALTDAQNALAAEELRNTVAGRIGTAIEPLTKPAGFDWRTDIALLGGIAAKEAIVSTLGTAYSLGEEDPEEATGLADRLASDEGWSKAVALAMMLFVLLYSPCFVALVVIRQEAGSWGWVAFTIVFNTLFAYGVAVAAHRIGMMVWG